MGKSVKEFAGVDSLYKKQDGSEISHRELYETVVNAVGLQTCIRYMPVSKERIAKALAQGDESLNTIPLDKWDDMHFEFKQHLIRIGITVNSLSDTVCTLKCAAKMWVESNNVG